MAKRRRFVPEGPINASLEIRIAPTSLSSIGNWFTSQYNHVKQDLGITKKPPPNAAAGIEQLWKNSATLSRPTHTHPAAPHPAASHHAASHPAASHHVKMK